MKRFAILATFLCLAACSNAASLDDARATRIISTLADDNRLWLMRDPEMVGYKYELMQSGEYPWLRGTETLFWRDLVDPGPWAWPTAFGTDGPDSRVFLLGDPHPENMGSYQTGDGTMVVDWDDFDGSAYGPYWGDVRRAAFALLVAAGDGLTSDGQTAVASALATSYGNSILALSTNSADAAAVIAPTVTGELPLFDDLLAGSLKAGNKYKLLNRYAPVDPTTGQRFMFMGDLSPRGADGLYNDSTEPAGEYEAMLVDLVASWRSNAQTPEVANAGDAAFVIKGISRRLGSGVSSYAALRFYVLLEGPTSGVDDDWLLEFKETADGVHFAGLPDRTSALWPSSGDREVVAQTELQAVTNEDVLLGHAEVSPWSFRVHQRTAYQNGIASTDLATIAAGDNGQANYIAVATAIGRMLARAHGRAPVEDGSPGYAAIAPMLAGHVDEFAAETAAFSVAYAAQTKADYAWSQGRNLLEDTTP